MRIWEKALIQLDEIERFSTRKSSVHALDVRVKLIGVAVYLISLLSFNRYEISGLIPFAFIPFFIGSIGSVPIGFVLRRVLIVMPFAFIMGIMNPLVDVKPMMYLGSVDISGGWVSFVSILLRCFLSVWIVSLLVATTGIFKMSQGLMSLGVPSILSMQILLVYRYLFVLVEEMGRMLLARELRSNGKRRFSLSQSASMVAHLLLRSFHRSEMIYQAMELRLFHGELSVNVKKSISLRVLSSLFLFCGVCICFRLINPSIFIGNFFR